MGVGAPVYYRSVSVGEVAAYQLAADGKSIQITVFVNAPYDQYVTTETRFWNASGIRVTAGANGVDIQTESIVSVLVGGLAFDVPIFRPTGEPAAANAEFALYQDQTTAMTQPDAVERRFVLYFNESLRGLKIGAPVTLFGLTVGRVERSAWPSIRRHPLSPARGRHIRARAHHLAPLRRGSGSQKSYLGDDAPKAANRLLRSLVEEHGLRARLETGSLLTGDLYVAFEYVPNAPKVKIDWSQEPLELPVASGGLASLEAKLDSILSKIDAMPLGAIGAEVKNAIASLDQTLKQTDALIARVDAQWVPEGTKTMETLHQAIADADRSLLGKEAPAAQDLHDTLQELTRAARAVRVFVDYLDRHPEALIRGKKEENP